MASACWTQRRIVVPVPAPPLIDPGTLILPSPLPPPPPPPPPPGGFYSVPVAAAPPYPVLVPAGPVVVATSVRLNPTVLIQMDQQRTQALLQFMDKEGLVPTQEEEMKRRDVIDQLKQIVLTWIKKVAWQHWLHKDVVASASATILTYGSYGLGVHGSESDIDVLCVGPYFATMEEDFFIVLLNMLQSRPEVSEIHCVKSAKVPLMRFKFNGISIDFPYAQIQATSVPQDVDIFDESLVVADETSWRSLSGVHVNTCILQLVPNLKNFQSMLRCIKLWARRRGVYSHLLGFFGGIHLAVLAAYVCQRHPNGSLNVLIAIFFDTFLHWPWPTPMILQDLSIPFKSPDLRLLMPIMMPCWPFEFCNSNITRSTFRRIMEEFQRGFNMTKDVGRVNFDWSFLFEAYPYTKKYDHFVRIFLAAPDGDELCDWVGWVKSRFRSLLLKLEMLQGFCDPNPTEYVDHDVAEPNTVFYWGLLPNETIFMDTDSVKEDFIKSVNKDIYGDKSTRCKLELSIVKSTQLPKCVQIDSRVTKRSKACWRILDYNHLRKPVYSQYLPQYFVGYVASDREYQSAVG
ncbi:nuclear poly(A) polymerase 3 isoform X1 [Elaeis guineensis]|uniref:polynucleotide adenylyltransferase n=1 Tax=Elaeis guineensis var. tenera TaxID=51953 RepID=A0A6I9S603_ELAGV|nr:nuclear poly(A) polymerase 3 isoform X1 [Elaeis guineensis]